MQIRSKAYMLLSAAVFFSGMLVFSGCGKKYSDISMPETTAAPETMAMAAAPAASSGAPSSSAKAATTGATSGTSKAGNSAPGQTSSAGQTGVSSVKTSLESYSENQIKISYPVVSGMTDSGKQKKANELLKKNALSILDNYPDSKEPIDRAKDSLTIDCKVVSADSSRITATYSGIYNMDGAAHPNNIFYANTVDLKSIQNLGLGNFTDAYTMAGYVLSNDVILSGANADVTKAFMEKRKDTTLAQYTQCFKNADFPLKTGLDGKAISWPDTFSYEKEGEVYFSVPVSHFMGDYVIVEYSPTTK